ncbi:PBP1A family penicillin-binding protein [Sphingosinicella sp. LY1275]|uniref:transglycosylase domain-containing protein n=1 Tax=Sphingosinicella sp. LY1275 TaxID=3095379 RepID=UPI002ADECC1D|nr:PBP1A family penicillin-binding protein [Sphingosinicella sp. LY1275]MEA1014275.1 PBP1A family penicillin-binding protein [Sphingosinicella sp. LY1275]
MASTASSPLKRTLITTLKIGVYAGLVGLVALVVAVVVAMNSLPSYQELVRRDDLGQMIRVRAADGSTLVSLGPSFGEWVRYDEIPEVMKDAMLAVEDRRYHMHPGVDPIGLARAVKVRVERGHWAQGGSTITQQLARNIFLTNSRTFGRKVREAILALALERRFSKEQILELYLNRVYFGGGAYGIDAASRRFFGHSADTLSLSEAAIIAGLVKAPSNYSPTADAEAARGRAGVVIKLMLETGDITPAEAASAEPAEVKFVPTPKQNSVRYFTDWVLPQLDMLIDESVEPIDVWTTLDPAMQRSADQAINANTPSGAQGALVTLDRDGAVRAMVGGRDYVSSIYNRATQATRQPGSAFKLFVYLSALEAGYTPDDTVVDEPITIGGWSPRNSSRSHSGPVTIREAFARSINTISARLGQEVGFRTIADMAQRFGITTEINTQPSMVLGTSDVRLIDMTRAFASVSQKGVAVVPYGIRRVTTPDGSVLYQHEVDQSRVLVAPWVAAQMTDLLQAAVLTGTGRAAQIGRPVAGKTGTTNSNKDGWFIGFSSGLTTGVWMGRDDAKALPGLQGGTSPARAFRDHMVRAVARRPVEKFDIEVALPDWEMEPDEEAWFGEPENGPVIPGDPGMMVDPDGNPIAPQPGQPIDVAPQPLPAPADDPRREELNQEWLDRAVGRERAPPPAPRQAPPPRQLSARDPVERRPVPAQP